MTFPSRVVQLEAGSSVSITGIPAVTVPVLTRAIAPTPSDAVDETVPIKQLFVGGAGNLVAITSGGDTVTFTGLTAGQILALEITRVKLTGTTATNLVGLS